MTIDEILQIIDSFFKAVLNVIESIKAVLGIKKSDAADSEAETTA